MSISDDDIERLVTGAKLEEGPRSDHRAELRRRVLAAFDQAQAKRRPGGWLLFIQSLGRWVMARPASRLGIPVAMVVAVGLAAAALLPAKRGFAFEAMLQPLVNAKTARCKVVAQMKGQPAFTFKTMFRGTMGRQESAEMGTVNICDEATGISLTLDPKEKTARILQGINWEAKDRDPISSERGFLQSMRDQILALREDKRVKRESLGERKLAGKTVVGYRVSAPGVQMDIWGDRDSGMPHSIVTNMQAFPNVEITMTDFEFDVELDDSLFSLTPPAGYTVTKDTIDVSKPSEEDFVSALRLAARLNDGAYPDAINLLEGIKMAEKQRKQLEGAPEEEREQEVNRVRKLFARCFVFPLRLEATADAVYAGKGVKLGDGDRPIFWYKPPRSDKYRIIRADLSVVEAGEAPRVEGAQQFAPPSREPAPPRDRAA